MKIYSLFTAWLLVSCSSGVSPEKNDHDEQFVQIFFHANLLDELDTFHGTYQKDLVMDGTARTTMWLTTNEQEIVAAALENYKFFSLPDTIQKQYTIFPDLGPQVLRISYRGQDKTIVWYAHASPNDKSMYFVEQLRNLLWNIIVAKAEYKALPPVRGGYAKIHPVISVQIMGEQMKQPFDLLLGRNTFEIFASYWPHHTDVWAGINEAAKYVASTTLTTHEWNNSIVIKGDVVEEMKKLKMQDDPDLHVYGSSKLIQTLFEHDLVDELWIKTFPIVLGSGNRLFAEGTIPAAFKLTDSKVSPSGIIIANYGRAGEVKTGSF